MDHYVLLEDYESTGMFGGHIKKYMGFEYIITVKSFDETKQVVIKPKNSLYHPGIIVDNNGNGYINMNNLIMVDLSNIDLIKQGLDDAYNVLLTIKEIL